MSTPVRAQDKEHFSIVLDSLARDGLHVAMVAHDRLLMMAYAGELARALASLAGLRVEAYNASRLESVVVDLMLHRFDAALSDISVPGLSGRRGTSPCALASQPGCILFVPDAHALSHAEFRQLLRIAAATQRNGLRVVTLFDADSAHANERIAEMGTQVARWDLDDAPQADRGRASSWTSWSTSASPSSMPATSPMSAVRSLRPQRLQPRLGERVARHGGRWLAAAGIATMLAAMPVLPQLGGSGALLTSAESHTVTRSGMVELAGEPRQDYPRAPVIDDTIEGMPDAAARSGAGADAGVIEGGTIVDDSYRGSRTQAVTHPEAMQR